MGKTIRGNRSITIDAKLILEIGAIADDEYNGIFSRAAEVLCSEALQARKAAKAAELS